MTAAPTPVDRPRICVVGSGWMFTSGISYYTCRLASTLAEQYPVSVVLMRRLIPRRLYPGRARVGEAVHNMSYPPTVRVFDGIDWFWLPSLFFAIRFLRRQRPDVVVLQWWTGAVLHSYLALSIVAKALGAKLVVEFHETQDTGEARLRGAARYLQAVGRWLLKRTDAFVVHSEFDREQVSRMFDLADRPLHVLPHGPFDHHQDDEPAVLDLPNDEPDVTTVLFFGTIRPYKGLEHLVEAFDTLPDEAAARLRLLIVGETWESWTRPLELAATNRHADRITIVNRYVRDSEIAAFFEASDVVALPYTRSSASGPLHIAMAHGRPVILTEVGGLTSGAAGYDGITWVPPNDVPALAQALHSAPDRRGERFTDPRSWDESRTVYAKIFDEVAR